jgi:hypothetical protein
MVERVHPKQWKRLSTQPVRRVSIPKPGKAEKRPLGIPVMEARAQQALVKLALEPEWEAKFEANSYGCAPWTFVSRCASSYLHLHQSKGQVCLRCRSERLRAITSTMRHSCAN